MSARTSWWGDAVRGGIAGGVGVWVMDQVTTSLMQRQSEEVTRREEAAQPNGKSSVANAVDRATEALDVDLDEQGRSRAAQAVHYGLGVVPGAIYGVARNRLPLVGALGGLAYGALVFAVNDEWLNASLGLSAAPDAYPTETHVRGLVGHLAFGAVTDHGIELLGG